MPKPRFARGSEWRKWDLQVHSPFSALNNGFGEDFDQYAKVIFERAVEKGIAVIGVTDYFSIDGYKALRKLQGDTAALSGLVGDEIAAKAQEILLLPNIEFRTSVLVARENGETGRVNFHVIFSDELSLDFIEEHFLRELKFTAESNPDDPDERWSLTVANLSDLGKKLKEQHARFSGKSDVYIGMMTAVVSHEDVTQTLARQASRFGDKYFLVTSVDEDLTKCSWDGQGHLARKLYIQKSHMLFSSNSNTRAFGLGLKHPSREEFVAEFKSLKPCIHGSDAHSYDALFEPAEKRHLWIKADPTFEGLRQVLHEPADRCFIGATPRSVERVALRPTKVVEHVDIVKSAGTVFSETWFDCHLLLNPELVTIIGNKGSGKSALADVLGLLGNTPRHSSFGFLKQDRFRNPKNNKARHFEASLAWMDATSEGPITLDTNPEPEAVEKIRYIPQNYLEEICNEVGLGRDSRFYSELQQVIFSHVKESEKLGYETLDQLLEHKGEEIKRGIGILAAELADINKMIVGIEERLTARHRKNLELQLAEKRRELDAHDLAKPPEVQRPGQDEKALQESKAATRTIEQKQEELRQLEAEIKELQVKDRSLNKRRTAADRLVLRLKNLQRQVEAAALEASLDLAETGLAWDNLVSFSANLSAVEAVLTAVEGELTSLGVDLNPEQPNSREAKRVAVTADIEQLRESLSAPERAFQAYLQRLTEWEALRTQIVGAVDQPGTVVFLERSLVALDALPESLREAERERDRKALEIVREKQRLRKYYEEYYGAVQTFLAKHPLAASDAFKVTFTVTMAESGFADDFLRRINRRKLGYFAGVEEGAAALKALMDATDWNSARSILRFANTVRQRLKHDGRNGREIAEQLAQSQTVEALYDYLFRFDYLAPIYRLTWDGKGLEQLSPGERGNLLLIFYLLVDRDEIPLVIDQPEENLDNQTVVRTLVPCIKDAKQRRQIVMVTHNPNLAVVCDAEQVIYAEIHKDRANEVRYVSGSIEDPVINERIIDVLEGTRPAFDKRDARYQPFA